MHPKKGQKRYNDSIFKVFFFLFCLLTLSSSADIAFHHKTTVKLINSLHGRIDLTLHCKSKDDDLGKHILHPGMDIHWTFIPNFWGTTQYYCFFQWFGSGGKWFDVYIEKYDDSFTQLNWSIRQEGPCFINAEGITTCYPWNKNIKK